MRRTGERSGTYAETRVYLYNVNTRKVHGPFSPQGAAGNFAPSLFCGEFALQLKVTALPDMSSRTSREHLRFGLRTGEVITREIRLAPSVLFDAARETAPCGEVAAAAARSIVSTSAPQPDSSLLEMSHHASNDDKFEPCFELQAFLRSLNLERHRSKFDDAEVTLRLLRTLNEEDLMTKLGLPFGPARMIVDELSAASETETSASDLSSSFRLLNSS